MFNSTFYPKDYKLAIHDLDGTLAEATPESYERMRAKFIACLAKKTGRPTELVHSLFVARQQQLLTQTEKHGLRSPDERLACGPSDELIRISATGHDLKEIRPHGLSDEGWHELIQSVYYPAYRELDFQLKDDAKIVLGRMNRAAFQIITNSPHEHVQKRLSDLTSRDPELSWIVDHVNGTARKFVITDDHPTSIPLSVRIPGLDRDVFPRRGIYFDTADRLRTERGAAWNEVVVIGDIAELDLLMFVYLGARVVLIKSARTLPHEIEFIKNLPNNQGLVIERLTEIF